MSMRRTVVSWLDEHAPRLIGKARYGYHVGYRGDIVYPRVTGPLYERLGSRSASAVDVGANVGIFTRYLCKHFAAVAAVEPVPYLADRLSRSTPANCTVHPVALGGHDGEVTLRIPVDDAGNETPALSTASSDNRLAFIKNAGTVDRVVPVRRLDALVEGMTNVAFVKIDVEGFEAAVLAGSQTLLADRRPVFQIEIGRAHNPAWRDVIALLDAAGYDAFALASDGLRRDVLRFIEEQPVEVSAKDGASPPGCWDYLFTPREKTKVLVEGLVRN
ncbi:FkbM family methyltransferase [Methylocystis sp.]|uniref:FkbM family methyltransferase n=1 Tax=Methylocystis sp. TaxID=1911079 RepID=UPI003DA66448